MGKVLRRHSETEEEAVVDERADYDWARATQKYWVVEDLWAKHIEFSGAEKARAKGAVSADVAQSFKNLAKETVSTFGKAQGGIGSGSLVMALADNASARGDAQSNSQSLAVTAGQMQEDIERHGIVNSGLGLAALSNKLASASGARSVGLQGAERAAKSYTNAMRNEMFASVAGALTKKGMSLYDDYKTNKAADAALAKNINVGMSLKPKTLGEMSWGMGEGTAGEQLTKKFNTSFPAILEG